MNKQIVSIILLVALLIPSVQTVRALEIERPDDSTSFERILRNNSSDYSAALGLSTTFTNYVQNYGPGQDAMLMLVSVAANTRHGIRYDMHSATMSAQDSWLTESGSYSYQDLTFGGYADDAGAWVLLPLPTGPPQGMWLRFYGADYKHVIDGNSGVINSSIWICSNGFISFDNSNSTTRYADGIPSPTLPNAVIAPLWTDSL